MPRLLALLAISLVFAGHAFAGARLLLFVHQPLSTYGTEGDAGIVVTRIPVLANTVSEGLVACISSPNKLLQSSLGGVVSDSNILSLLGIRLSATFVRERHYRVVLDLRKMLPAQRFGVTTNEVIEAARKCLRATFEENDNLGSYELFIRARKSDPANWKRYEERYEVGKRR